MDKKVVKHTICQIKIIFCAEGFGCSLQYCISWHLVDNLCLFLKKDSEETWDIFHGLLLLALQQQTNSEVLSCLNTSAGTDAMLSSHKNAVILVITRNARISFRKAHL